MGNLALGANSACCARLWGDTAQPYLLNNEVLSDLTMRLNIGKLALAVAAILALSSIPYTQIRLSAQTKQEPDNPLAGKVNQLFAEWDMPGSPGCALAIVKDGQVIYKRGYGIANLEYNIP